jgi:hypothetical protein
MHAILCTSALHACLFRFSPDALMPPDGCMHKHGARQGRHLSLSAAASLSMHATHVFWSGNCQCSEPRQTDRPAVGRILHMTASACMGRGSMDDGFCIWHIIICTVIYRNSSWLISFFFFIETLGAQRRGGHRSRIDSWRQPWACSLLHLHACMHGSYCAELRCAVYILYVLLRVNLIWSNANANANANRYPMHAIKRHTVTVDSAQTVALIHQFICSIESCNHLHACVHAAAAYILHAEHAAAAHACVPRSCSYK